MGFHLRILIIASLWASAWADEVPLLHLRTGNCVRAAISKFVNPPANATELNPIQLNALLGRRITPLQKNELDRVIQDFGHKFADSGATVIARENRLLREAGFKQNEIETLREAQVLKSGAANTRNILPSELHFVEAPLTQLSRDHIRALQSGAELHYAVDSHGQLFVSTKALDGPDNSVLVLRNTAEKSEPVHLVHESGVLNYSPEAKNFVFNPRHTWDLSQDEISVFTAKTEQDFPGLQFARSDVSKARESRHLTCLDLVAKRQAGESFVMDSLIAGNLITTAAIVSGELAGAGRLDSPTGQKVLTADYLGGNINSAIWAAVSRSLILKNTGYGASWLSKGVMGTGLIQVQDQVYRHVLGEEQRERSDELTNFNRGHFLVKLPINDLVDRAIMQKLPVMLYNTCLQGGTLSVFLSPRSVRIYERTASTGVYYMLRSAMVNETGELKPPLAPQKPTEVTQ